MPTKQLFNLYFKTTFKSILLHCFLIIFEYYPIIISTLDSPFKIKYSFSSNTDYIMNTFNICNSFPFRLIPDGLSNNSNTISLVIIIVLLIQYYTLNYTIGKPITGFISQHKPRKIKSFLIKLYVNFYDLIYYRYCSLFIMLLFVNVIIFYLNQSTLISGIVAIVIIIIFIVYYMSMMTHVKNYATVIHIHNNAMIRGGFCYPFDYQVSYYYQIYLSIMKLIISIAYCAFHYSKTINFIVITINIMMILLLLISGLLVLYILFINTDIKYYIFNREVNFLRMTMILFNFIVIAFIIFFNETLGMSLALLIVITCFAFIWTLWIIIVVWYKIIIPLWYNGVPILEKVLYITLLFDFDCDTTLYNSSFNMSSSTTTNGISSNIAIKGRANVGHNKHLLMKGHDHKNSHSNSNDGENKGIFNINVKTLLDTIQLNHQMICQDLLCKTCKIYSKEIITGYDLIKLLKYYCKEQMNNKKYNDNKVVFYNDMFMYFYYHFNKKTFIFYSKYKSIVTLYKHILPNVYINVIDSITYQCRTSYNDNNDYLSLYNEVMMFYDFNNELLTTLKATKDFINLADILKYPCRVFELANDITQLQRNLLKLTQIVDTKDDMSSNCDISIKTLKNVYKYNLVINRFIVESLTNEVYHQLNPLDIDALDEYLLSHYQNDKVLILSFNFKDQIISPDTIIILKTGNEFIKHRLGTLISLFPKKFKEDGMNKIVQQFVNYIEYNGDIIANSKSIDTLAPLQHRHQFHPNTRNSSNGFDYLTQSVIRVNSQINSFKQNKNKSIRTQAKYQDQAPSSQKKNQKTYHQHTIIQQQQQQQQQLNDPKNKYCTGYFEYLVTSTHSNEEFVEHFKYSFSISQTLINNSLLIHGHYTNDKTSIIIFQQRKSDHLLYLDSFSSSLRHILQINPQWIDTINASDTPFYMTSIFKYISSYSNIDYDFEYECVFEFNHFYYKVKKFRKAIEEYYNFSSVENDKNEVDSYYQKMKDKLLTGQHQEMKINLQRRMALDVRNKTYIVYSVHFNTKITRLGKSGLNDEWKKEEDDILFEYQAGYTYTATTTSMTNENSIAGSFSRQSDAKKNRFRYNPKEEQDHVSHITKTFSVFSWLIILFNCIIIFLCVFFLILQVVKANQITKVNDLFYKFKSVRLFFAHGFVSALCNICIANRNMDNCINPYLKYSNEFNFKHGLSNDYDLRHFIKEELKQKITFLQARFVAFKDNFYLYGDTKLLDLSSNMMTYVLIIQKKDELDQVILKISFEEAIRKYLNSLTVLSNAFPISYDEHIVHIINVNNQVADFNNIYNKNLNDIQRQFYEVVINYNNYLSYYTMGEKALLGEFMKIKDSNEQLVIILMILIALFNVISFALCFWNISIAQNLFMHFISNMITMMGDNGLNKLMSFKVKNLIRLSRLYYKNPNDIIHEIKKNALKPLNNLVKKQQMDKTLMQSQSNHNNENPNNDYTTDYNSLLNPNNNNSNTLMNNIILSRQLRPFRIKMRFLSISYLIIMIIVDIVVFIIFLNTFLINDYAELNASYENKIYTILALIQMKLILNITENDLANSLGYSTIDNDGVINMKIRETMSCLQDIYKMEQKHRAAFPPIGSYYPNKCNGFFAKVNDPLTKNINAIEGKDYFKFQDDLCMIYDILDLPDYDHLYSEQMLKSQNINNLLVDNNDWSLMTILRSYEYMDLITMTLMVTRPLRYQLRNVIFDIHLKESLANLITVMIIYLSLNIMLDVCIFLFIKFQLAQKMHVMHENLLLLQKCFQSLDK